MTQREFEDMEFREFLDREEIAFRKWEESWRHTRLIAGYISGVDPRKIIRLRGDYDNIPKRQSTEENLEYLKKLGFGYIFKGSC